MVRDDERTRLAYVSRVSRNAEDELAIALKLWPGTPRAMAVRAQTTASARKRRCPRILLAESPEDPATLVVPPRTFTPGRLLRSMDSGAERKFRLTRLVQRGADFERVAFDEA